MSQFIEMFASEPHTVQIKDICSVVSGKSIPTNLEDAPGEIPYIKVADFNNPGNERYIINAQRYVAKESADYSRMIPIGSVIFAKNGAASMSNKKRLTRIRCCIDMNTMAVIPTCDDILPEFLFATIEAMDISTHVRQGAIPSISPKSIEEYYIALPTREEQIQYISIAHQADKSEFDGLKSQFIEMFTNNNFEMVPLGDLCDKISDGSHNPPKGIENSKYLMISSKNVFKDHLDLTDVRYLTEEDFEVENKRTNVKANDVLLTIVGTIGRTYLVKGDEGNLVMQRSVAVLTPNSRVTPLFLMFYLHSDKNLEKEGRGNTQKGIYLKQLSQYEIKVPSIDLQKQFEAIYRQADKSESAQELVRNINYN